ncbi:hypothetical protein [Paracoccus aestuariivivens]|uniref:Uncharacterized protein n=1 Tax=Paracoccus aestuariivivens TaxID=1820333 RepID=A0A6L6JG32_9RHOB|nr:hypothetical protein [Paracoccus aestuariivivens]MTH80148.1 hypothetical protein [Paracoccus aestuariivivens]
MRETIDLLAEVVAAMSQRLGQQDEKLEHLRQIMAETRKATLSTRDQTDPKLFGRFIGNEVNLALDPVLDHFADATVSLRKNLDETTTRLQQLETAEQNALERLRNELAKAESWRRQRRWVWTAALVAGAVLGSGVGLLTGA